MNNKVIGNEKDIIFYNDEEGNTKIEVLLQNEDVWLNTEALAELFSIEVVLLGILIISIKIMSWMKIAHVQKLHIWVMMVNKVIIQNTIT